MLNLKEISEAAIAFKRAEERRIEDEKRQAAEREKQEWIESRKLIVADRIASLTEQLEAAAKSGSKQYRVLLDHDYYYGYDPLYQAYLEFAKNNKLNTYIDNVPVYEVDYDRCTTRRVEYYETYLRFNW